MHSNAGSYHAWISAIATSWSSEYGVQHPAAHGRPIIVLMIQFWCGPSATMAQRNPIILRMLNDGGHWWWFNPRGHWIQSLWRGENDESNFGDTAMLQWSLVSYGWRFIIPEDPLGSAKMVFHRKPSERPWNSMASPQLRLCQLPSAPPGSPCGRRWPAPLLLPCALPPSRAVAQASEKATWRPWCLDNGGSEGLR